jgi:PhzF family phenazine biosynthesis protein
MRYAEASEPRQMIYHVDAFTETPFAGNPAGVCILKEDRSSEWMQAVAREINLSETAFMRAEPDDKLRLRWFTPQTEVALCGHATLATAHILFSDGLFVPGEEITFQTLSGELRATKKDGWLTVDLPARPVTPAQAPFDIAAALGGPVGQILANEHDSWLVEMANEAQLRALTPDFAAMRGVHGVIVTCRSASPDYDFVSRYFAPSVGIDEDPVTGSAHCSLAPYWAARLGKTEMTGYQASARGGVVRVRLDGDRVFLSGQAVMLMQGIWHG